jgi:hypothetical protein
VKKFLAFLVFALVLVPTTTATAHHRKYTPEPLLFEAEGFCDDAFSGQGETRLGGLAKIGLEDIEGDFRRLEIRWQLSRRLNESTAPWQIFDTQLDVTDGDILPSAFTPEWGHHDYRWKLEIIARWVKGHQTVIRHRHTLVKLDSDGLCHVRNVGY